MSSNELSRMLSQAARHIDAGRTQQAKEALQRTLMAYPMSGDAHFQLAVILHDENDLSGAVRHFQSLLKISPELAEVHFNVGTLLKQMGRTQEAAESFERAVKLNPAMADAHNNLGVIHREQGDLEKAVECFERAIKHAPKMVPALVNLGAALVKLRRPERAIEACRLASELSPDLPNAHFVLGLALELAGQKDEAVECMERASRLKGDNEIRFHLAASKGVTPPPIAPPEYVASLFDAYATRFESHLRDSLHYRTPEHIYAAVCRTAPDRRFDVMDLGCGTGLCGQLFRSLANRLIGIDLSSEMIRETTSKNLYDELYVQDITECLTGRTEELDLILAADVFVYVGDLDETFRLTAAALRDQGLFAFSAEADEPEEGEDRSPVGYRLSPSRRYVHSIDYVRRLAEKYGLREKAADMAVIRTQGGENVQGWIVVLEKPGSLKG